MNQTGNAVETYSVSAIPPPAAVGGSLTNESWRTLVTAEDYWYAAWDRIRHLSPKSILLRCPSQLGLPCAQQWHGSTDMDILVPATDYDAAMRLLKEMGFYHVYKGQSFIERFQVRVPGHPIPCMVDLYRIERWGRGFRLARQGPSPAEPRIACLMRCVVDTKGTAKFEKRQSGPPWQWNDNTMPKFGRAGRALWRTGNRKLLILYLLLKGTIRPELKLIFRGFYQAIFHGIWQWTQKEGLEVVLLGVDGSGKTTVANELLNLPAPIKVVYMGPHDFRTRFMRFCARNHVPALLRTLAFRYESLVRRLSGWRLARHGWIVLYDRLYPFERIDPRVRTFRSRLQNALDRVSARRVDMTFWLTGDYATLARRKNEFSIQELKSHDDRYVTLLEYYRIPFERIDVTKYNPDEVCRMIGNRVLREYQERSSIDRLPNVLRAILV